MGNAIQGHDKRNAATTYYRPDEIEKIEGQDKRSAVITYSRPDLMKNTNETIHCTFMNNRFSCDKECNKLLEMVTPFYSNHEITSFKTAYFHNKMCENILVVENNSKQFIPYDGPICINLDMLK